MRREFVVVALALLLAFPVFGADRENLIFNQATTQTNTVIDTPELDALDGVYVNSGLFQRYGLVWVAGAHGMPGINADVAPSSADDAADGATAAELALMLATDLEMEVLGSSGTSDDVTHNAEGGLAVQTDGGGTDSVIILPHLDTGLSTWATTTWGTDQQTAWECVIETGSDITPVTIWVGLKLTNTPVVATDANQAFFRFQDTVNGGEWQAVHSIADTDDAHDTNVVVAVSSSYHLKIVIDSYRVARFWINGVLVETSGRLTTGIDLIPYIGILEGDGNAKSLVIRGQAISRVFG